MVFVLLFLYLFYFLAVGDGTGGVPARLKGQIVVSLDQGQVVAGTKVGLEEERGSHTAQLAVGNDRNSVTQDVSFIHVMSG